MDFSEFEALFAKSMQQNRLNVPDQLAIKRFYEFDCFLHQTNAVTNLTAIRTTPEAISKHYADSLLAAEYLPQGAKVLDIGCGPGFPSIPLAIYRPDLSIFALDSTAKKIAFVQEAANRLELSNLVAVSGRAEDKAIMQALGQFDMVVSRAVARMNVLCELCLPYVKIGGLLLALKAAKAEEETTEALRCIKTMGGAEPKLLHKSLIHLDESIDSRCLIYIEKKNAHPRGYPRAYAQILKKPL